MNTINIDYLAELTNGFSGAELKNLINEGAINAARLGKDIITGTNIEDALEKLIIGIIKKNDTRTEDARLRVSIHEIGHAFLTAMFPEYFELQKVTIQSTYNGAGGYTLFSEHSNITDSGLYTKDILKKRLVIALGGKAAEYVFYGDNHISLGAVQDLKQANQLSREMVGYYGMGNELNVFYNEDLNGNYYNRYSENIKSNFDKETLDLINEAYKEAVKIISEKKDLFNKLVQLLLKDNTLSGKYVMDNL